MFLLTDAQVPEESFLVLINDLLASGEIPGLFADDEVENIISGVRNEVKGAGLQDTRENCWMFFIERVRRNLKVKSKLLYRFNRIFVRVKLSSEDYLRPPRMFRRCGDHTPTTLNTLRVKCGINITSSIQLILHL